MKNISIIFVLLISLSSCSRIMAPEGYQQEADWQLETSEHYRIYYRSASYAEQHLSEIIAVQESTLTAINGKLGLNYRGPVSIFIYHSTNDAGWGGGKAYPATETVEAIYSPEWISIGRPGVSAHEITHVIATNAFGRSGSRLMSEGIAVAMDGIWHANPDTITDLHRWAKKFLEEGELAPVQELIRDFGEYPSRITYPVSGSFVTYLLDNFGVEKFGEFYARSTPDEFKDEFSDIYEKNFQTVRAEWEAFVLEQ